MPDVSVLICTKNRPESIKELLEALNKQTYDDFEVVIIDDSDRKIFKKIEKNITLVKPMEHIYRGGGGGRVSALNYGIRKCSGEIIAFTDDDCLPSPDWIQNAVKYFVSNEIIGIEGLITSNIDPSKYRTYKILTNKRFLSGKECLYDGFMTANMFYRKAVLNKIGGFDEKFEPFLREDSDLAWRAMKHGKIIFAKDVIVFHPAITGKSFNPMHYMNDAYLFYKHPKEYIEYFKSQYLFKEFWYWVYLIKGAKKFNVYIPIYKLAMLTPLIAMKKLIRRYRKKWY